MTNQVVITWGENNKPASSKILAENMSRQDKFSGELIFGFPLIVVSESRMPYDAILISPTKGIVIFDLIEGHDSHGYKNRQDDWFNKLDSKLRNYPQLLEGRKLLIPISTISFGPVINITEETDSQYLLANGTNLLSVLDSIKWDIPSEDVYKKSLSVLQNITTIRSSRTKRVVNNENSRGAKLKQLENSISTLDPVQNRAVLETFDGVQRIRGLAGSGKTIVLALKAAFLHSQYPDWRIAVTFYTRSLKGQFKKLINNFVVSQTGIEPDWDNIRVVNAWGVPGKIDHEGIYSEFCREHNIEFFDFGTAQKMFGRNHEFSGVCKLALSSSPKIKNLYDAILIDEAQDFPPEFLQLCYGLLDSKKRLVYAYDELQNLSGESLPSPEEIFGKKEDGTPNVIFSTNEENQPKQDITLDKCYRNSRPILVTAHSLGFGIYRETPKNQLTGLVQMFESEHLWSEIGYSIRSGSLTPGKNVVLYRNDEASPRFLENHSPIEDLIHFESFPSEEAQSKWVVDNILNNIKNEELRCDDIIVINPNPLTTRENVGKIRRQLFEKGIQSHLAGIDTDPDVFYMTESESITFSGIYRAKGNEGGMVYIINSQDCYSASTLRELAVLRNRLFTAITRSKAWVRVLGIGEQMDKLIAEFNTLKLNNFELNFTYPTEKEFEFLKIVHRDMTPEEKKRLESRNKALYDVLDDIESGRIYIEDLDDDVRKKLEKIFIENKNVK